MPLFDTRARSSNGASRPRGAVFPISLAVTRRPLDKVVRVALRAVPSLDGACVGRLA